jgi:hypothetical protein
MIRMHVREQHGIDRLGIDSGCREVTLKEAGGWQQIVGGSGVDDRGAIPGMDREGVDAGPPRRPKL